MGSIFSSIFNPKEEINPYLLCSVLVLEISQSLLGK